LPLQVAAIAVYSSIFGTGRSFCAPQRRWELAPLVTHQLARTLACIAHRHGYGFCCVAIGTMALRRCCVAAQIRCLLKAVRERQVWQASAWPRRHR